MNSLGESPHNMHRHNQFSWQFHVKQLLRERSPALFTSLRNLWRWPERIAVSHALAKLKAFKTIRRCDLVNPMFLEEWIPGFGLHPSSGSGSDEYEWPWVLRGQTGKGLRIWQYPNQFSQYLVFVSSFKIETYLEVGVAYGGTFVFTLEYLDRLNPGLQACCIDVRNPSLLLEAYSRLKEFTYISAKSADLAEFIDCDTRFDLAFIDGDHSRQGVINDFLMLKDRASIIGFHDIVNFKTPGAIEAWAEIKRDFADLFEFHEFVDQYADVGGRDHNRSMFGIGVAVSKNPLGNKP